MNYGDVFVASCAVFSYSKVLQCLMEADRYTGPSVVLILQPLYGEFYLPRKFKISVAVPPTNDVDIFTNNVGFMAIVGKDGELEGFSVTVGGGMGVR
ncbi:hypothetical protein H0H87_008687, partial [Tephrocybe sp. NHM501043]